MKSKLLISVILMGMLCSASVTFNVNMSEQDVGDEGPTLWMGAFYPEIGFVMTDVDEDNVWSYTIDLEPGVYTYKFRNGWWTDWNTGGGWEEVPQECEVGQWGDREVVVANDDIIIDSVCFSSCSSECVELIYANVTFQVDMNDQELSGNDAVYVQGSFNGWCGYCNPMSDVDQDGIWELTINIPVGTYEYLFTTNGWDGLVGGAPQGGECDFLPTDEFGNYGFTFEEDILLGPYCFGTCFETCVPPAEVDVTFNVNMNDEQVDPLGVFMIGNFQEVAWDPFLPTAMSDDDNDGIYSLTLSLLSDQYIEYKFQNGLNVESDEGIGACGNNLGSSCQDPGPSCNNRYFQIPTCYLNEFGDCVLDDISLDDIAFNSCDYTISTVYFNIDFNDTAFPNEDYSICGLNGSWNASDDGGWIGFGLELSDLDGDGIFSGSMNLSPGDYEFVAFCSGEGDDFSGWGHQFGAPVSSECDFDPSDEWGNYGFTVEDSDINVSYCAGSCSSSCDGGEPPSTFDVTFDIDGVEDCDFVSITGTFDNWSGWGAHTDNGYTASIQNGDYEYLILCVDASVNEWWNDIWGASTQYLAPLGSECDWDPSDEFSNYGFTVNDSDLLISLCAGSCDVTCGGSTDTCIDVTCDEGYVCEDGVCVSDTTQIDLPVDFEDTTVNYTMTDFGGNVSSLETDPYDSDNMAIEVIKTNGAETWAGTTIGTPAGFATNIPLSLSNSVMAVRVWSTQAGTPIRLKVEDSNDPTHTCETETNTTVSGWQVLEFDFSNEAPGTESLIAGLDYGWTYNMASIFFNFGIEGIGETYYFDDIQICDEICEDETCLSGDANSDGIVNVVDVVLMVSLILDSSSTYNECGDVNGDGILNVVDIVAIVAIILGN